LHNDVELPLIAVIQSMEAAGVRVDRDILRKMAKELAREIGELETKITAAAGCTFNPGSPKQLGEVLFDRLEIHKQHGKKPRQTKTGYATGQEILEEYEDHPVVALVMEHRSKSKLLSTYVEPLPDLVDEDTGRIHTSFHQTGAATGRISSTDPNLQNIPIRTPTGRRIREAFLPSSDHHVLLSADYSQIELRIMATCRKTKTSLPPSAPAPTSTATLRRESSGLPPRRSTPPCAPEPRRSTSASFTGWARNGSPARRP
jgi:DNA polymerase-1